MQPTRGVKRLILLGASIATIVLGCGRSLSRPVPSKDEYLGTYMKQFDPAKVERLDYGYDGSVGGYLTAARVQFKAVDRIGITAGTIETGNYDPASMTKEPAASEFRALWAQAVGSPAPSWFDFPFDRRMRTIRESRKASDARPNYEWTWYIDDEQNVVYFLGRGD